MVVSDIKMPEMNGFEFARSFKEARNDMPLALMTAFEIDESEFSSLLQPTVVAELLKKLFSNAQLIRIVRKYVGITGQH